MSIIEKFRERLGIRLINIGDGVNEVFKEVVREGISWV